MIKTTKTKELYVVSFWKQNKEGKNLDKDQSKFWTKDGKKNSKRIWTIIRRKQAIDSIQNSSGKPNHQAMDNWEIKLPDKGQLLNRLQHNGLGQSPKQV